MFKLVREGWPPCLENNYLLWTERFISARAENSAARFRWYSDPCYQTVRQALLKMTHHHCAFCDGLIGSESRETVEHFQPKSRYPERAFHWDNLFPCCDMCQSQKGEKYDERLIKPDHHAYTFAEYFICNYDNGEIEAAPDMPEPNQLAAKITIEMYGLNLPMRKKERLKHLKMFYFSREEVMLNEFPYRYFLES